MQTFTQGYCRTEQAARRFRFAGYATANAHENTVRPRAYYQSCGSCALQVLTLGGHLDVPDALGLCRAVLDRWLRHALRDEVGNEQGDTMRFGGRGRAGVRARSSTTGAPVVSAATRFDAEAVLGDLYAHIWHVYNRWDPTFGDGTGTFRGYATTILSKKVNTFIARETGDAVGSRTFPKAHSRSVSISWEGLAETLEDEHGTSGLDVALGSSATNGAAGSHATGGGWVDIAADRGVRGVAAGNGRAADG